MLQGEPCLLLLLLLPCLSPRPGDHMAGLESSELMGHFSPRCALYPAQHVPAAVCWSCLWFGGDNKEFLRNPHQCSGLGPVSCLADAIEW